MAVLKFLDLDGTYKPINLVSMGVVGEVTSDEIIKNYAVEGTNLLLQNSSNETILNINLSSIAGSGSGNLTWQQWN